MTHYAALTIFAGEAYLKSARTAYGGGVMRRIPTTRGGPYVSLCFGLADCNCAGVHRWL